MKSLSNKIELLAPAGNFEKLEVAIHYGADAVYIGGKEFSLRNFANNFSIDEIDKAVQYAHKKKSKVFVTCNVYPRTHEHSKITNYLKSLAKIKPDAVIIADPGILSVALELLNGIPLHLSTQANTTSLMSVEFWRKLGVKRVNLARELTLDDIAEISANTNIELEVFVHGAMCISYSGRCLLSSFLADRDGNQGMCAQSCRWKYAVTEEKRPGIYFPIAEDNRGHYFFNSKDLCMIEHIPELIKTGLNSFKIEGRMKSINYVASSVKIYRQAIDSYYNNPDNFKVKQDWLEELNRTSNRGYCKGFFFGNPDESAQNYVESRRIVPYKFVGKIIEDSNEQTVKLESRNKIFIGDLVEIISPNNDTVIDEILSITTEKGESVEYAQPLFKVYVKFKKSGYKVMDLVRRPE